MDLVCVQQNLTFIIEKKESLIEITKKIEELRLIMERAVELEEYFGAIACRDLISKMKELHLNTANFIRVLGLKCEEADYTAQETVAKVRWELQNMPTL